MSNRRSLKTRVFVVAGLLAAAQASPALAQSPRYDRALELASFDTAWKKVRDSYYDATMRGLDWVALRDSLRPLVERAESRAETRAVISTLLSRLGESHFGVLPGEAMDAGATATSDRAGDAGLELRFVDSALVVSRVESGSLATSLGVTPGWIIETIDTLNVREAL